MEFLFDLHLVEMTPWSVFSLLFTCIALLAIIGNFVYTLDDLIIDGYAAIFNLKPRHISELDLARMRKLPEKQIGILIANWHEDEILARIVSGNIAGLEYSHYTIFLGVYPNDEKTWNVAQRISQTYPSRVQVIVNSKPGPTSKGQMLNEMVRNILQAEFDGGIKYDFLLLQDSEDVIHPLSLKVINESSEGFDFIQIPVFSFHLPLKKFVGGTYVEEFGEIHTKDLLVRQKMGAAIPSAGVGTAISRSLIERMILVNHGNLLKEDTLTEDYHLGITAKRLGFKSRFIASYVLEKDGRKNFIATREYFPSAFWSSVKQKTRWTLGIVFQGSQNLGWNGTIVDRYFLMRDRKGPLNCLLFLAGTITLLGFLAFWIFNIEFPKLLQSQLFLLLAAANLVNMTLRILQRMRAVYFVYQSLPQALMVPLRLPVGNVINGLAAVRALQSYRRSRKTGEMIAWSKTTHQIPDQYGFELPHAQVPTASLERVNQFEVIS